MKAKNKRGKKSSDRRLYIKNRGSILKNEKGFMLKGKNKLLETNRQEIEQWGFDTETTLEL